MPINFSTSPAIFRWQPACWLRVSGADAASFLQGQFTNDLRPVAPGRVDAVYGLWLSLKGKVLADSFVLPGRAADERWIGSYFSSSLVIRERLESHVIADDVVIEDVTKEWSGISVLGVDADGLGRESIDGAHVFRGRRDRSEWTEWVYPLAAGEPGWVAGLAAPFWLDIEAMERRRINAAIPSIPADIGPADLPNEGGLDTEAISYTKGCYLGQEVMARLKSMGQVRRRLLRVRAAAGPVPALPAPLFMGGRQIGEVRSAVVDGTGWVGLAMLSLLHLMAGEKLALALDAAPDIVVLDRP